MPINARKVAFDILNTLDRRRDTLDNIMDAVLAGEPGMSKRDRAFAQALVFGVMRWRGRLDFVIREFSRTRFDKIDPGVLNILRMALFQILYMDRVPDSAAVNTAVALAKTAAAPWVARFVNAVLRKAAREYRNLSFPEVKGNAIAAIATNKSFPKWIVRRWAKRYGLEAATGLCDALNVIPAITVRTNRLKTSRQDLAESLAGVARQIKPTLCSPDGVSFVNPSTSIPELTSFKAGWFQVQDEAAQLVSLLLDPQPGENVLDACAGLGGKTGHIAQLMKNKGSIVAIDVKEDKLLLLESEMQRLGITIVETVCRDLEDEDRRPKLKPFDRLLLDAPCSGLGVMRRNPDIKWRATGNDLALPQGRQLGLLKNLARLVKPSGVLVYAVCSPEPEENEDVVNEFLKKSAEFVIDKEIQGLPDRMLSIQAADGWFKTFPHFSYMDGFSFIRLKRNQ